MQNAHLRRDPAAAPCHEIPPLLKEAAAARQPFPPPELLILGPAVSPPCSTATPLPWLPSNLAAKIANLAKSYTQEEPSLRSTIRSVVVALKSHGALIERQ